MNNTVNKINKAFTKEKKNASQDFRFISEEDGGVIFAMAVITVGLLFARCHLIFGAHPLGLAMIAALPTLVFPGLIGVIVGSLTLGEDGIILAVCAALTVIVRLFASRGNKNEKAFLEGPMLKMSSAVISGFSASVYEAIVNGLNMTTVFYSLSMILIPTQVKFLPMGDNEVAYCEEIAVKMTNLGMRVEIDRSNNTIGYKIRAAQQEKVPYMLVVGAKEIADGTVAVRSRKEGDKGAMPADQFISELMMEIAEKRR